MANAFHNMSPKKQKIKIENLFVNPKNPRFDPVSNQKEAIKIMLKELKGKIKKLASDIANNGLNPGRSLLVLKKNNEKYIVLDGNRRLTAIKLILDPKIIKLDDNLYKFFKKIKEESGNSLLKTLECAVFTNKEDADRWVELEHTGENQGTGQVQWDAEQKLRFKSQTSGSNRKHTPVLEFMKKNNIDIPRGQTTNIERIINTADAKEMIGIKIKGQSLSLTKNKKDVVENLKKMVKKIKSPGFKVGKIYEVSERKKFVREMFDEEPSSAKTIQTKRNGKIIRAKTLLDRKTLIPENFDLNISQNKVNLIYKELKELKVDDYRNAVAVLFRVFLELSVNYFIKKNSLENKLNKPKSVSTNKKQPEQPKLSKKLQYISEHMEDKNILTKNELKPIRKATSDQNSIFSTDTFNSYVHNLDHIPVTKDLKATWDNYEKFIKKLWE